MRTVTIEQVLAWNPCQPAWPETRIRELAGDKTEMSAAELAALPIPAADRLWLLLHEELIPEKAMHELACVYAERALLRERAAGREPDARSWNAIAVKRAWLRGEATDAELAAAGATAWAVAGATAWATAGATAWAVAGATAWATAGATAWAVAVAAAWAVARAAAGAAAWAVARAAAGAAAWADEIEWQVKQTVEAATRASDVPRESLIPKGE